MSLIGAPQLQIYLKLWVSSGWMIQLKDTSPCNVPKPKLTKNVCGQWPLCKNFAIRTPYIKEKQLLTNIQKTIQMVTPYQLSMIHHGVLYILTYHIEKAGHQNYIRKILYDLLCKFDAYCGVCNLFNHLTEITPYRIQAESALDLGISLQPDQRIFDYRDFFLPAILAPRINDMAPCNYLSPAISILKEYDKIHQSDFFDTLKCYILNLCNTKDTTSELHIHRNSLLYRINKIEELTNLSVNAP